MEGPTLVLSSPHERDFRWPREDRKLAAHYFKMALGLDATLTQICKQLPRHIPRWGSYRVKGEGDIITSAFGLERRSEDSRRDSSFVRVSQHIEKSILYTYGLLR